MRLGNYKEGKIQNAKKRNTLLRIDLNGEHVDLNAHEIGIKCSVQLYADVIAGSAFRCVC